MGITFPFQPPQKKGIGPKIENKFVSLLASLGAVDMKAGGNMVDGLPTSELTIAEGLQQAGYKTGIVGKWHLGDFKILPQYHPNNHGFDWFVGFNASNDDWPVAFHRGEEEIISDIGLDQKKYTQLFTDEASGFISRNKDEPFFLFISHKDPHQPFYPSDKFAGKSKAGRYGDAVEELDNSVGEILQSLEQNGLTDNTIIIFTSDNGPWYEGNPGGLRGRKGMSYEGGNKVPFLIQYKGKITAGSVHTDPAMGIDLLPTIFSAAGVSLPQDRTIDGISLLNRNGKIDTDAIAASRPLYFASGFDFEAVRQGRFKLIDRNSTFGWPLPLDKPVGLAAASAPKYSPPNSDVSIPKLNDWPKLYDIVTDPTESYNISGNFSLEEQELKQTLEDWRTKFRKNPTGFK